MECDVGVQRQEIDAQKPKAVAEVPIFEPIQSFVDDDTSLTTDTMGLETTWNDESLTIPLPPPPSSLVALEYSAEDAAPFSDELDLFPPVEQESSESYEDPLVDSKTGEPGVCGLRNLGNTCFMSAGVQSLMATAPLVSFLMSSSIPPQHLLTKGLAGLTRTIWTSKQSEVHPTQFRNSLVAHFPQFDDNRHHDCQEFLALLLDCLHEQMNTAPEKSTNIGFMERNLRNSSDKKTSLLDDQFHPSTSHENGGEIVKNVHNSSSSMELGDVQNPNCKINKSCSSLELNNLLSSNLIPSKGHDETLSHDLQFNNVFPTAVSGDGVHVMNNSVQPHFSGLEDILKTAKTSNINVLVQQEEANNEIRFDSEKYPRLDNPRRRGEQFNSNSFHLYENNTGGKRSKSSVTHFSSAADFKEGLDLKRVRLHSEEDEHGEKNKKMELERQSKHGTPLLEKNERLACERLESNDRSSKDIEMTFSLNSNSMVNKCSTSDENEADEHWRNHLSINRSVIVDSFQGQFKSTVVCSACNFVSVTYEPFMYLSVPLPNALQRQITVTYMRKSSNDPVICSMQVNKYDSISTLKEQLKEKIDWDRSSNITMTEVLDHHISKILDDSFLVRHLNDSERRLYAFETISHAEMKRNGEPKGEDSAVDNSCTICLEEKSNMKQHERCSCKLCEQCISDSCQHHQGTFFKCPVCRINIFPDVDLQILQNDSQSTVRMINVPVVFRNDKIGDGNNNQKRVELFGHPRLLRIPSTISSQTLHGLLKGILPCTDPYKILLVDGKGHNCSRCLYSEHCRGCQVSQEGDLDLSATTTLAVVYSSPINCENDNYRSELAPRQTEKPLMLYDCIEAFSKSEQLDGNNPWFCPRCEEHRCATKTLTVWRCPDYLIVYLKRFVFRNSISTKLEQKVVFPLAGLSLPGSDSAYDLYACVCHIGGLYAGHYTAYTRHPYSGQWHHFNDSCVTNKPPQDGDYSDAYILFYRKQGIEIPALYDDTVNEAN